jgi:hypothetical protein
MHENGLLLASQRIPVHPPLHRAFNSTRPVLSFKELRGKLQCIPVTPTAQRLDALLSCTCLLRMLSTGLPERSQFSGSTAISFPRFDWPGTTVSHVYHRSSTRGFPVDHEFCRVTEG